MSIFKPTRSERALFAHISDPIPFILVLSHALNETDAAVSQIRSIASSVLPGLNRLSQDLQNWGMGSWYHLALIERLTDVGFFQRAGAHHDLMDTNNYLTSFLRIHNSPRLNEGDVVPPEEMFAAVTEPSPKPLSKNGHYFELASSADGDAQLQIYDAETGEPRGAFCLEEVRALVSRFGVATCFVLFRLVDFLMAVQPALRPMEPVLGLPVLPVVDRVEDE
ncbi:MAG: hypothetical protein ACI8RZ_000767 [Myxococcota bacterium]|jgi:hypothetical protein